MPDPLNSPPALRPDLLLPRDAFALAALANQHNRAQIIDPLPSREATWGQLQTGSARLSSGRVVKLIRAMVPLLLPTDGRGLGQGLGRGLGSAHDVAERLTHGLIRQRWDWLASERLDLHAASTRLGAHLDASRAFEADPAQPQPAGSASDSPGTPTEHPFEDGAL